MDTKSMTGSALMQAALSTTTSDNPTEHHARVELVGRADRCTELEKLVHGAWQINFQIKLGPDGLMWDVNARNPICGCVEDWTGVADAERMNCTPHHRASCRTGMGR